MACGSKRTLGKEDVQILQESFRLCAERKLGIYEIELNRYWGVSDVEGSTVFSRCYTAVTVTPEFMDENVVRFVFETRWAESAWGSDMYKLRLIRTFELPSFSR